LNAIVFHFNCTTLRMRIINKCKVDTLYTTNCFIDTYINIAYIHKIKFNYKRQTTTISKRIKIQQKQRVILLPIVKYLLIISFVRLNFTYN